MCYVNQLRFGGVGNQSAKGIISSLVQKPYCSNGVPLWVLYSHIPKVKDLTIRAVELRVQKHYCHFWA